MHDIVSLYISVLSASMYVLQLIHIQWLCYVFIDHVLENCVSCTQRHDSILDLKIFENSAISAIMNGRAEREGV